MKTYTNCQVATVGNPNTQSHKQKESRTACVYTSTRGHLPRKRPGFSSFLTTRTCQHIYYKRKLKNQRKAGPTFLPLKAQFKMLPLASRRNQIVLFFFFFKKKREEKLAVAPTFLPFPQKRIIYFCSLVIQHPNPNLLATFSILTTEYPTHFDSSLIEQNPPL